MLSMQEHNSIRATLTHNGSHGGIVKAHYENSDECICFIVYASVGSDYVITQYAVNPRASVKEAQLAGDKIDAVLEAEATRATIKRLLIVFSNCDIAEVVRTYKLQPFTMGKVSHNTNPNTYLN